MSSTIRQSQSQACLTRTAALLRRSCGFPKAVVKNKTAYLSSSLLCPLTQPSRCFKTLILRTLEKLFQKDLVEKSAEKRVIKPADLQNFRFHPSTQWLRQQGYYATAYRLSLLRAIKDERLFSLRQTKLISFAPKPCNVMVGMDKYGNQYIHAFQPLADDSQIYRITASEAVVDSTLAEGLRRRMRHAAPGGVAIAKAFNYPPLKFEIFIDRSHTVYLRQPTGDVLTVDTLNDSFKAADVSANGRFIGLITADGFVRRYDIQQRCIQEIDLNGDSDAFTISIASDGTLYIGSRQHTYIATADANSVIKQGPGLTQTNAIFCLSTDEKFLISQRRSKKSTRRSEIVLKDLESGGQETILLSAPAGQLTHAARPHSIAFSPLNALIALGYQDGLIEIFTLTDPSKPYAPRLTSFMLPQYSVLPCCPLVSFAHGFDQLHITYRGRGNAIELGTFTFGLNNI